MQVFNKFNRCLTVAVSSALHFRSEIWNVIISKEMAYSCKKYLIDIIATFYLIIIILLLGFRPLRARYYSN